MSDGFWCNNCQIFEEIEFEDEEAEDEISEDDFMHYPDDGPNKRELISRLLLWPPPEQLLYHGNHYERISYSQITDEQRAAMTHVLREGELTS